MSKRFQLHEIFSEGMILQRNQENPIWGTGPEGMSVTLVCQGQQVHSLITNGKWQVILPASEAGGPHILTVSSEGQLLVEIQDVYFGDVWLAGGQSNMEWPVRETDHAQADIAEAHFPLIRYFDVPRVEWADPAIETPMNASWKKALPEHVPDFSAVAYHFAQHIQASEGIPIGIIGCNWGGTSASCWVNEATIQQYPELQVYLDTFAEQIKDFDWVAYERIGQAYDQAVADYEKRKAAGATKEELGGYPWPPPTNPHTPMRPCGVYETMLLKIAPYGLKGFLFYQGESDVKRANVYDKLLTGLIDYWRSLWHKDNLPFHFVQLPSFSYEGNPDGDEWALLRESQTMVNERIPHTGMAIALDCGERDDIHPRDKRAVGYRLALTALELVYARELTSSGPVYRELQIEEGRVVLHFDHTEGGLALAEGSERLIGFQLAEAEGPFMAAEASIEGSTVVLWHPAVAKPTRARYAWTNYTEANLLNGLGLPAGTFRTIRENR
ncbi:sialate O-acetylesterase [Paenibacillus qinlingensis]|uniref:Sialate O-acetylesterase n=1 Tax=Paenibacillus qinlingensis TaxID=1837343 RepID=A0ABU1P2D1_9BACL|nr:sialate O-acetylesterase [Paenibacillus qinlingensis]MDR6553506.1 sialate O-acetylesterase [Paenibacillus qinlingensis]